MKDATQRLLDIFRAAGLETGPTPHTGEFYPEAYIGLFEPTIQRATLYLRRDVSQAEIRQLAQAAAARNLQMVFMELTVPKGVCSPETGILQGPVMIPREELGTQIICVTMMNGTVGYMRWEVGVEPNERYSLPQPIPTT